MKPPPEKSRRPLPPEGIPSAKGAPTPAPTNIATSVEKGHGREEKRTLRTTSILTLTQKWAGMKQAFELKRERRIAGHTTIEVVHGITSLSPTQASAAALLAIVRNHWKIENQLHYVRDVTLREDACRVRSGSAPQILAALRNAIIHLLSTVEAESRPAAIESLQINPAQAMKLIGVPQCE